MKTNLFFLILLLISSASCNNKENEMQQKCESGDRSACSRPDKNDAKSTVTKIFENFKELVKDDEDLTEKTETPTTPTEKIEDSNNSITCLSGEDCETKGRDQQEKNEVKAMIYFEKGCEFENGSACWMAAGYYEEGLKVEKDLNKAKKLHQKSCDNGFNYGCKALSEYPYPSFDCANDESAIFFAAPSAILNIGFSTLAQLFISLSPVFSIPPNIFTILSLESCMVIV